MSCILLLGDAHLGDNDPEAEIFIRFLDTLSDGITTLYLLGDLFDLWIGTPPFTTESQRRVVEALRRLRGRGIRVTYLEGNRDYHLRRAYLGDPFDDLSEEGMGVSFGARRLYLAHGDLVNRRDRPYRIWRRLAKGPFLLSAFRCLPSGLAGRVVESLERRIKKTNWRHRIRFPEEECHAFARERREAGFDTLVLGHFHSEIHRTFEEPSGRIEVFVLPAWREARRYLRIGADGAAEYDSFASGERADRGSCSEAVLEGERP